ncbi:tRNA (N6-isopentenyl adenosine(37)-C2)-methylthiotransferase MiaB [Candidatus Bealeia paramacronuclearis]|uniref:tRNA-2-methylthio-N(6)-dimethylallyladenosine synthase n=1 Tax=Candidatus Bealeia paramacronuclearis TaxID=1921001 RepID=A0ABZ2C6R7_9PROT|nr:tRNA (N6-isopentenyl adenosine(37)-C2)-methylthiotransferase MiaB [Candidatus Bealeia paramacronuclearis]
MKKVYIKSYGCQMNVYDSGRMIDLLKPLGYEPQANYPGADIVILNTCHIREKADEKLFSDLGRIRPYQEEKSDSGRRMLVIVAGCVGQAQGGEIIKRTPYVDIVLGPQTYHRLPEMIARALRTVDGKGIVDTEFPLETKFDSLPEMSEGVGPSAFLSIQEGCDKFCTFCVVPYTRGAEFSRPVQDVLREAQSLADKGVKEITLLGQNVNAYHGIDPQGGKEWGLGRLLEKLSDIKGVERLRYMTSHPRDMDEDLILAHRDLPKVMPFLHLPVQSGSDRILEAMNRKHKAALYFEIIQKLREVRPDIALSSDFIVGFPGETEADFEATLNLVRDVKFHMAYSFKYSPRPGTPGSAMESQVPEEVKSERLSCLQDLLISHQIEVNQKMIGQRTSVLLDRQGKREGQYLGRNPYMQSVYVEANPRLWGQIVEVDITDAFQNSLTGKIVVEERVIEAA